MQSLRHSHSPKRITSPNTITTAMAKLIAVFGATGAQGSSVVNVLFAASGYKVRALTRNPDSSGAKALAEKGCEVVKVDMEDASSLENALKGCYGAFVVTNYWGLLGEEIQKQNPNAADDAMKREVKQGKLIADASKKLGLKHVIYSGLENASELTKKPCQHLDGKALVEKYLDETNVPNTSARVAFYFQNFLSFFVPQKGKDGTYSVSLPVKKAIDAVDVNDLGPVVLAIFNDPGKYIGQKVGITGDKLTMDEFIAIISEATGKTVKYNLIPYDTYAQFPFPGAAELASMFEFFDLKDLYDVAVIRSMHPKVATFKEWAENNKDKLIVA